MVYIDHSSQILHLLRQNLLKYSNMCYTLDIKLRGGVIVKLAKIQITKAFAALTYYVAAKGAGLASYFGWYQPKVPAKLSK